MEQEQQNETTKLRNSVFDDARTWLHCVDEYKNGKLVREAQDPSSRLIRRLLEAGEAYQRSNEIAMRAHQMAEEELRLALESIHNLQLNFVL